MISFDRTACIGCGACAADCFPHAIRMEDGRPQPAFLEACIHCGHCIAVCPVFAVSDEDLCMDEVREIPEKDRRVDPELLLNQMTFRRATRHFRPDPLREADLARILEAGRRCPTAKNRQATEFVLVEQEIETLRRMAIDRLADLGRAMRLRGAAADMLRRAETFVAWQEALREDPELDPLFFHAPALLLVISDEEGREDAAAAAAYMELEAVACGLGVLYSGYFAAAARGHEGIARVLGLEDGRSVIRCLVLGTPDIRFFRTVPREPLKFRRL